MYAKRGPPHSFIHVDDFSSPKELAAYITYLDGNDTAYQEYHAWKFEYERTCPSLNFFCNFCQKLYNVQGNTLLFTSRMILQVMVMRGVSKTAKNFDSTAAIAQFGRQAEGKTSSYFDLTEWP